MRKVAIVGQAPLSFKKAPFDDPSWDIWGFNQYYDRFPRYTKWFDFHNNAIIKSHTLYYQWLCNQTNIMLRDNTLVPNADIYPLDNVLKTYGTYFNNTAAFLVALAIEEGYNEIGLFGIELNHIREIQLDQRSCLSFILGVAAGKGIKITVPNVSTLLRTDVLYGFEKEINNDKNPLRSTELNT